MMKVESKRRRWFTRARRLNFEVDSPRVVSVSHNIIYTTYGCSVIQSRDRSQATWIVHPRFIYLKRFETTCQKFHDFPPIKFLLLKIQFDQYYLYRKDNCIIDYYNNCFYIFNHFLHLYHFFI